MLKRVFALIPIIFLCTFLVACSASKKEAVTTETAASTPTENKKEQRAIQKKQLQQKQLAYVKNAYETAKLGQLPEIPFTVGTTTYATVKNDWGEPDLAFRNTANFVQYRVAKKEQIATGLGVGLYQKLYEIRSYVLDDTKTKIESLPSKLVEKELGKPAQKDFLGPHQVWYYAANQYTFKVTIQTKEKTVRSVAVYIKTFDDSKTMQ